MSTLPKRPDRQASSRPESSATAASVAAERQALARLVGGFVEQIQAAVVAETRAALERAATRERRPRRPIGTGSAEPIEASVFGVQTVSTEQLNHCLIEVAAERRLSPRESQILAAAVHGVPRRHLAAYLDSTENTIATQVRSTLRKLGQPNVSDAVWWVRQRAGQR